RRKALPRPEERGALPPGEREKPVAVTAEVERAPRPVAPPRGAPPEEPAAEAAGPETAEAAEPGRAPFFAPPTVPLPVEKPKVRDLEAERFERRRQERERYK